MKKGGLVKKIVLTVALLGLLNGGFGIGLIRYHATALAGDNGSQSGEDNRLAAPNTDEFFFLDPAVARGKIHGNVIQNAPGCDTPHQSNPDCATKDVREKFTVIARQKQGDKWPFFAKMHGFKDGTYFIMLPEGTYKLQSLIYKVKPDEQYRWGEMSEPVEVHAGEVVNLNLFHDRGGGI